MMQNWYRASNQSRVLSRSVTKSSRSFRHGHGDRGPDTVRQRGKARPTKGQLALALFLPIMPACGGVAETQLLTMIRTSRAPAVLGAVLGGRSLAAPGG